MAKGRIGDGLSYPYLASPPDGQQREMGWYLYEVVGQSPNFRRTLRELHRVLIAEWGADKRDSMLPPEQHPGRARDAMGYALGVAVAFNLVNANTIEHLGYGGLYVTLCALAHHINTDELMQENNDIERLWARYFSPKSAEENWPEGSSSITAPLIALVGSERRGDDLSINRRDAHAYMIIDATRFMSSHSFMEYARIMLPLLHSLALSQAHDKLNADMDAEERHMDNLSTVESSPYPLDRDLSEDERRQYIRENRENDPGRLLSPAWERGIKGHFNRDRNMESKRFRRALYAWWAHRVDNQTGFDIATDCIDIDDSEKGPTADSIHTDIAAIRRLFFGLEDKHPK